MTDQNNGGWPAQLGQQALGRDYLLGERISEVPYAVLRRVTRRDGGPPVTATQLRPDLANDPQVRAVFGREAEKLRYLRHSSIVGIEDVVIEPGQLVLVTEPANRPDLRWLLADSGGTLPSEQAAAVGGQIADALAAGHAHSVRHLDLRPENVLVAPGRPVYVKINNFGLAALLREAGQELDSIGGPTEYTAPEVRAGGAPSPAADVYSLGAILAELVTGRRPQPGIVPDVGGELGSVVDDCLAVDPGQRPSAQAIADRLTGTSRPDGIPMFSPGVAPAPDASAAAYSPPAYPPPVDPPPAYPPMTLPPPLPEPVAARRERRMPRGPLLTVAAGVVLAVVLGALSANAATQEADRRDAAAEQPPPAATVAPTPAAQQSEPPSKAPEQPPAAPNAPEKFRAAYAGRVEGGGATIAIAVRDGGAVAYLCDGKRLEEWLLGTASAGKLSLSGPDGASLTGNYDKNRASGSVVANGRTWSLDVPAAEKPSGLYRSTAQVRGARVVAGWIVLPGGDQVGMVDTDGVETPAPRLDVSSRSATVDGVAVTAEPIDGTSDNGF